MILRELLVFDDLKAHDSYEKICYKKQTNKQKKTKHIAYQE